MSADGIAPAPADRQGFTPGRELPGMIDGLRAGARPGAVTIDIRAARHAPREAVLRQHARPRADRLASTPAARARCRASSPSSPARDIAAR